MERNNVYVKHDADNCECCQDFWGAPVHQARDTEIVESDTDSGYCSITLRSKDLNIPNETTNDTTSEFSRLIVPLIVITPLTDDEQIQHNACIRASLLLRNPNAFTTTTPSTITSTYPYITTTPPSTASLIAEEALPSPTRSAASLSQTTQKFTSVNHALPLSSSSSTLCPPEESWSHRLKDTYENRMAYPQYFDIPTPLSSSKSSSPSSSSSTSTPSSSSSLSGSGSSSSSSCSGWLSSTTALRRRASKDALELHPAALPPVTPRTRTTTGGSGIGALKKRWSIAGSGVGFGFGKSDATALTSSSSSSEQQQQRQPPARTIAAATAISNAMTDEIKEGSTSLKRRSRVISTRSLSSAPSSASSSSHSPSRPPSRSASVTSLPSLSPSGSQSSCSTISTTASSGGSSVVLSGGPLRRWSSGGGAGGAFGKGMKSLKGLYSGAPSSFRMLA